MSVCNCSIGSHRVSASPIVDPPAWLLLPRVQHGVVQAASHLAVWPEVTRTKIRLAQLEAMFA